MNALAALICAAALMLVVPAHGVFAYGNGGGNGGDESHEHYAAGVSCIPNPNGEGVIGSSIWSGPRPAGPFEEAKSIQDAWQDLLSGYKDGKYSRDQVREIVQWANKWNLLGNKIYDPTDPQSKHEGMQVRTQIKTILAPRPGPSTTPTNDKLSEKIADFIDKHGDSISKGMDAFKGPGTPRQKLDRGLGAAVQNEAEKKTKKVISRVKKTLGPVMKLFGYP
jgi:hypothetical protein